MSMSDIGFEPDQIDQMSDAQVRQELRRVVSENISLRESQHRVFDSLVEIASSTNDAMEDGDRGLGNVAITLTVYDDASGWLGQMQPGTNEVANWTDFDTLDELCKKLRDHGADSV